MLRVSVWVYLAGAMLLSGAACGHDVPIGEMRQGVTTDGMYVAFRSRVKTGCLQRNGHLQKLSFDTSCASYDDHRFSWIRCTTAECQEKEALLGKHVYIIKTDAGTCVYLYNDVVVEKTTCDMSPSSLWYGENGRIKSASSSYFWVLSNDLVELGTTASHPFTDDPYTLWSWFPSNGEVVRLTHASYQDNCMTAGYYVNQVARAEQCVPLMPAPWGDMQQGFRFYAVWGNYFRIHTDSGGCLKPGSNNIDVVTTTCQYTPSQYWWIASTDTDNFTMTNLVTNSQIGIGNSSIGLSIVLGLTTNTDWTPSPGYPIGYPIGTTSP
jgi:hypothetical protein